MSDESHIGQRVAYWRKRRGLERKVFADRVDRSVSWLDKVEKGERALVRLPMLERVAAALGVEVAALTDDAAARQASRSLDAADVQALRDALQRYQAITRLLRPPATQQAPPDLEALRRQVGYVWTSFQSSRYAVLGTALPSLLLTAQDAAAAFTATDDDGLLARSLLSQSYQVTASTLWKLKEPDLAWLAAERGLMLAEQTGDALLISDAARRVAQGLMVTDHKDQAMELISADIGRLEPGAGTAAPDYLSMYGMLFLLGSVVASRAQQLGRARDLLSEGKSVAARLGEDRNERWTAFGPTNVNLHRVAALVDHHEAGTALQAAGAIDPYGLSRLPIERRANFRIDVARAHAQAGHDDHAADELWQAYELAPDEVRCRPLVHELVTDLHSRSPRPTLKVRQLATAVGLQT